MYIKSAIQVRCRSARCQFDSYRALFADFSIFFVAGWIGLFCAFDRAHFTDKDRYTRRESASWRLNSYRTLFAEFPIFCCGLDMGSFASFDGSLAHLIGLILQL